MALLLLGACGGDDGKGKKKTDDTAAGTIAPPASCPVGNPEFTEAALEAHLELVADWNALRTGPVPCSDGSANSQVNAVTADEALMWTARCWAHDIAKNGQPPAADQFTDGSTLTAAANQQGYTGILTGWSVQGGLTSTDQALERWLAGDPAACARLWDDATTGAMASARASDGSFVVVRLSGL